MGRSSLISLTITICLIVLMIVVAIFFWGVAQFRSVMWSDARFHHITIGLAGSTLLPLRDAVRLGNPGQQSSAMALLVLAGLILAWNALGAIGILVFR